MIAETKNNNGWINNFTHWHNVVRDGNLSQYAKYIRMLAEMNAAGDIAFCGYGEALAYMVFREAIEMVEASIECDRLRIILHCNSKLPIDYDLLLIPITVRVFYGEKEWLVDIPYAGSTTKYQIKI